MIFGIGIDLIEIKRIEKACEKRSFLEKVFTAAEQQLIADKKSRAAGCFAVKEAVVKVFGTGFAGCSPIEIEVLRKENGKPYVNLYGKARQLAKELEIDSLFVTITNTNDFAAAVAVGECNKKRNEKEEEEWSVL